jgi:hypothetical protein
VIRQGRREAFRFCRIFAVVAVAQTSAFASDFQFDRETFAFRNSTVFEYYNGRPQARKEKVDRYTRRCFVMSRAALQFHKFARFDPHGAPLDDKELARRIRYLMRHLAWHEALPADQRVVFPGYANLREMSKARTRILQDHIGRGWPTYARVSNARMFFLHGEGYQQRTQANLEAALARGEFFVAYLSSYPYFTINHSVLVYAKKPPRPRSVIDRYIVYDPNHPDAPRELKWSSSQRVFNFQKDEEFVGGFTRVFQVYGKPLQ